MRAIGISILCLLFLPAFFVGCKKETTQSVPTPTDTIEGVWTGKYGFDNETPSIFFSFNIKPGGVIEELNSSGLSKGSGTWQLNGTTLTAHYQWKPPLSTIYSVSATFDKSKGELTGTWGYDNSATDGGKWTMKKKN